MDSSSSIPANTSTSSQSNPTESESTSQQPKKRNPAFSKESLRSTLEEISRETEQISQGKNFSFNSFIHQIFSTS